MSLPTQRILVPVTGGSLAVFRYGDGVGDPVLLIHGVTSSNRAFQLFADELIARGKAVYAVDLRGRGDSNTLPEPFGMAQHAHDMAAVIEFLQLKKPDVIGHSMGGFVAAALVGLHPELIGEVVFADGGIPLPLPPGMNVEQVLPFVLGPALARLALVFESKDAYRDFWRSQPAFSKGWSPVMDEYVDYDLRGDAPNLKPSTNPAAVEADSRDLFGDDLIVRSLKGLTAQAQFIKAERGLQNEEGGLYPLDVLNAVLPQYPMLKLEFLSDCNHYDMFTDHFGAEKVAQIIYGDRL
ncbi:MAG: alpha/beta hydrolase [Candidatus Planktophila sp.]|nr:alpha/beta hydrolase [Candidatus Planktophila sp.]